MIASPGGGGGGHGVEVVEVHQAGGGFVVVATDKNFSQFARAVGDFVGAGAVAHYVAQVGDDIERRGRGQTGFERFEVGVNVANQQNAQGSPDKLAIIAQGRDEITRDNVLFGRPNERVDDFFAAKALDGDSWTRG